SAARAPRGSTSTPRFPRDNHPPTFCEVFLDMALSHTPVATRHLALARETWYGRGERMGEPYGTAARYSADERARPGPDHGNYSARTRAGGSGTARRRKGLEALRVEAHLRPPPRPRPRDLLGDARLRGRRGYGMRHLTDLHPEGRPR